VNTCCLSGVKREKVDAAVVRTRPVHKVDLNALAALYEKWGWDATLYDGAE
jgi:hypothetical protein